MSQMHAVRQVRLEMRDVAGLGRAIGAPVGARALCHAGGDEHGAPRFRRNIPDWMGSKEPR